MSETKMMSVRLANGSIEMLNSLTYQLKQAFGDAINRSEILRLAIDLLEDLGIDNIVRIANGDELQYIIKKRSNE